MSVQPAAEITRPAAQKRRRAKPFDRRTKAARREKAIRAALLAQVGADVAPTIRLRIEILAGLLVELESMRAARLSGGPIDLSAEQARAELADRMLAELHIAAPGAQA